MSSKAVAVPHQRTIPAIIKTVKVLFEKAEQASEKAEQYYTAIGLNLKELKDRKPKDIPWPEFAAKHFPMIGRSRGYELLQLADGKTTVEKTRAGTRDRMAKSRAANRPSRDGQPKKETKPATTKTTEKTGRPKSGSITCPHCEGRGWVKAKTNAPED